MPCVDHNEAIILKFVHKLDIEDKKLIVQYSSFDLREKRKTLPWFDPCTWIYGLFFNLENKIKDLNMWPIGLWNTKIWPIMPKNPP
jgi:hypothetical protein